MKEGRKVAKFMQNAGRGGTDIFWVILLNKKSVEFSIRKLLFMKHWRTNKMILK